MSYTYNLHGRRYLRKYTAALVTPSTAAASDAIAIGVNIGKCPWQEAPDVYPSFPVYSAKESEGRRNSDIRDYFDTAEWCQEHDDGAGTHRAYANACMYRYIVPDSAVGARVLKAAISVTCDPYTPQGARIAFGTTDDPELPMLCSQCRTLDMHSEGVFPRTEAANDKGVVYWYETTGTVEFEPDEMVLGKYLLVFVGLETWRARNGWLEGAAKLSTFNVTLDREVDGWLEGDLIDASTSGPVETPICRNGVLPMIRGDVSGIRTASVTFSGDDTGDGRTDAFGPGARIGLATLFARWAGGCGSAADIRLVAPELERRGASFCVTRSASGWRITSSALLVPFAVPNVQKARRIRLDWSGVSVSAGARICVWLARDAVWEQRTEVLSDPGAYDGETRAVGPFTLIARFDGSASGSQEIQVDQITSRTATLMITAFLPFEAVEFNGTFPQGLGTIDADVDGSSFSGSGLIPDITLIG